MARQAITMVRGTTLSIGVSVTDENGDEYTLGEGETLRFGVKRDPDDASTVISKSMTSSDLNEGVYEMIILPYETASLAAGRYVYDVGLQSGSLYYNIIEPNEFIILPNVTTMG